MIRWLKKFVYWFNENDSAVSGRYEEALYWSKKRAGLRRPAVGSQTEEP